MRTLRGSEGTTRGSHVAQARHHDSPGRTLLRFACKERVYVRVIECAPLIGYAPAFGMNQPKQNSELHGIASKIRNMWCFKVNSQHLTKPLCIFIGQSPKTQ